MNEYVSTTEAAKILGISRVAVFKKIKSGQIKAKKVGRNFIINKKDLLEMAAQLLSPKTKAQIDKAVSRVIREYGETLRLLGKE